MINLEKKDFIKSWIIPPEICDDMISYYKTNPHCHQKGTVISSSGEVKVDESDKESVELEITKDRFDKPFNKYRQELQKCLDDYVETYPHIKSLNKFNVYENYNIQYYPPGGGFKKVHFERNGSNLQISKRCLVFMTYLNDVENAGTKFIYQNVTTPAVKGLTVLWPADWTHTHVGVISQTQEKYIATGWFSYLWGKKKDYVWVE